MLWRMHFPSISREPRQLQKFNAQGGDTTVQCRIIFINEFLHCKKSLSMHILTILKL